MPKSYNKMRLKQDSNCILLEVVKLSKIQYTQVILKYSPALIDEISNI